MCESTDLPGMLERLDAAATAMEAARVLAEEDRVQVTRLIVLVERLIEQGDHTLKGTLRLEKGAQHVASDLAASIERADHAPAETPGAGADAALRSAQTSAEKEANRD